MLPADAIVRAAARWLRILRTSSLDQGWGLIRADSSYTDLTQTQYASALEWLRDLELVAAGSDGVELAVAVKTLPQAQSNQLLFERSLELAAPAWLPDADILIPDASELPQDAAGLAETLGLSDNVALLSVRHIQSRIDLAQRAQVGLAGELALIHFLDNCWPGSTVHIARDNDGFGYDVLFRPGNVEWHLEVKSTTRRGRLVIYLSRHEHEVAMHDSKWRLIVVGLDDQLRLQAIATVRYPQIVDRAPRDVCSEASWQSTSHQLTTTDLEYGLSFLEASLTDANSFTGQFPQRRNPPSHGGFAWMPPRL
jgi:hypothetical protein